MPFVKKAEFDRLRKLEAFVARLYAPRIETTHISGVGQVIMTTDPQGMRVSDPCVPINPLHPYQWAVFVASGGR
jgi:hypothetical protein